MSWISKNLGGVAGLVNPTTLIGTVLGGGLEYIGGQQQNAANKDIAQRQMDFQDRSNRERMTFEQGSVDKQMAFQKDEATIARNFEERMSNSAYQRAMADMKSAGVNPMLAFSQGGASTPSASAPSGGSAGGASSSGAGYHSENVMGRVGERIVSSALDMRRLKKDIDEADSRINLNEETAQTQKSLRMLQDSQKNSNRATAKQKALQTDVLDKKTWFDRKFPRTTSTMDAILGRLRQFIPFTSSYSVHREGD